MNKANENILDAEGDGGAVPYGHEFYDASGIYHFIRGTLPGYAQTKIVPLYTHPARSGVVSDEDVDAIGFALIKAGWRPPLGKGETSVRATLQSIAPPKASAVPDVQAMVNQFLSWRLPNDFAPDAGISFNPGPTQHLPHCWPTGTCLFTAAQAEQMIRYMLAAPQPKVQP